jgi:hypothetical protein
MINKGAEAFIVVGRRWRSPSPSHIADEQLVIWRQHKRRACASGQLFNLYGRRSRTGALLGRSIGTFPGSPAKTRFFKLNLQFDDIKIAYRPRLPCFRGNSR